MGILAERVRELLDMEFDDTQMTLRFTDGGLATAPIWWYPRLQGATVEQRRNWVLSGAGRGIHWPDIDEDLAIAGILEGRMAPGVMAR